jgi:hypothetical protein
MAGDGFERMRKQLLLGSRRRYDGKEKKEVGKKGGPRNGLIDWKL